MKNIKRKLRYTIDGISARCFICFGIIIFMYLLCQSFTSKNIIVQIEDETETPSIIFEEQEYVASFVRPIKIEEPTKETETEVETETETEMESSEETIIDKYYNSIPVYSKIPISEDLQIIFKELCKSYNFSYDMLLAWMYTESRWHSDSVSKSGAVGYMQIMPCYWEQPAMQMGLNIYEPVDNVAFALYLINEYLQKSNGDMTEALKAYNGNDWYPGLVYENYETLYYQGYFQ